MPQTVPQTSRVDAGFDAISNGLNRLQRLLASRRISNAMADAAGVGLGQQGVRILRALRDGEARPVAETARVAHMDIGAASRQLRKLDDAGLIERGTSADNASVVLVRLSPEGLRLAGRLQFVTNQHLRDALDSWTSADRQQLGRLLGRLVEDLQRTPYRR